MIDATKEYIINKTSRYPQLVQAPLCPGPGSVCEEECWSRTQEPAEGCSSERRRRDCRLESSSVSPVACTLARVHCTLSTLTQYSSITLYTCSCNAITTFHTAPYSYPLTLALYCSSGGPEFKENFGKLPSAIFNAPY